MRSKDYNLNWTEYFKLDEESPSGLVRTRNQYGEVIEKYNVGTKLFRKNGKPCGWHLGFQKKNYYVHRILWVLIKGSINPELVIDHLDGNPFNNQISNLTLKSKADNGRNQCKRVDNTSGITGIRLDNKGNNKYYYTAHWLELDGSLKRRHFSVDKLGEEKAKNLAILYREDQIRRLIEEGADYTGRHGN